MNLSVDGTGIVILSLRLRAFLAGGVVMLSKSASAGETSPSREGIYACHAPESGCQSGCKNACVHREWVVGRMCESGKCFERAFAALLEKKPYCALRGQSPPYCYCWLLLYKLLACVGWAPGPRTQRCAEVRLLHRSYRHRAGMKISHKKKIIKVQGRRLVRRDRKYGSVDGVWGCGRRGAKWRGLLVAPFCPCAGTC